MQIVEHPVFSEWFEKLKDNKLMSAINIRLVRVRDGNLGDCRTLGDGISELRIHYGAGYRIYYTIRGKQIIILLCAGNKSEQTRNIKRAKLMAQEV